MNAHLGRGVHADKAVPHGLRQSDAAFDGTLVRTGNRVPRLPEVACAHHLALDATHRMLIRLIAQVDGVHAELHRQLVHGLLQGEGALRMTRSAHGRRRTGVDEDVVLFRVQGSRFVEVRRWPGAASARAASRGAVGDQMDGGDGAVLLRSDAQRLVGTGAIADGEMLLLAIEHQPHRCARLLRERCRHYTGIARSELGAETAAHEFRDDAHLCQRNLKEASKLFAHAGRALRRSPDRQ